MKTIANIALCICGTISFVTVDTAVAQQKTITQLQTELLGPWLVTVAGEDRTRTLRIVGAAQKSDGPLLLEAVYGWTDGNQTPVPASANQSGEVTRLLFTTQANSQIAVAQTSSGTFEGTFTDKNGAVKSVRIQKVSDEELQSKIAAAKAARSAARIIIKVPSPDVSAECASWLGGWEGKWTTTGYTGEVLFWVTEVAQDGSACNITIRSEKGVGTPPKPLIVNERSSAEFLCNSGTQGNCWMKISFDGSSIEVNYRNIGGGRNWAALRKIVADK